MATAQTTATERRELRSSYRELCNEAKDNQDELKKIDGSKLCEMVGKADSLFERVDRSREAVLDSSLMRTLSQAGADMAKQKTQASQGRRPLDFVRCLQTNRGYVDLDVVLHGDCLLPDDFNWQAYGRACAKYFKPAPTLTFMLGPLDARPKERAVTERRKRAPQTQSQLVKPEEKDTSETKKEKQATEKIMEQMWTLLKERQSAPMVELVLNHESFAQTVENMFALSFLVRDQKVGFLEDPEEGLIVQMNQLPPSHARGGDGKPAAQFIIPVSFDLWEEMKQRSRPEDCIMPHRLPEKTGQPCTQDEVAADEAGPSKRRRT